MPFPSVVSEVMTRLLSLIAAEYPAITLDPKVLITPCMTMFPTEMKLCCKILGMAMTAIFLSMLQENIAAFWWVSIFFKRLNTKITARIQLTPWHRKVAHATPSTPLEKTGESTVTNKISIPILEREEIIRKIKGVLESPRAEKIPVATL